MKSNFLLTYTVQPMTMSDSDKEKADKVRKKIASIDEWVKYSDVETTFMGEVSITSYSDESRKRDAKQEVKSLFLPILKEFDASEKSVTICCVMMVHHIDTPFEFEIKF
ncbi:hypothetical protein AAH211_22380 [Serratia fonticola]|uniref:hypothetical protein n=1 Tax=Serratia fonticola TaxID=47917 RepID=UPI0039880442